MPTILSHHGNNSIHQLTRMKIIHYAFTYPTILWEALQQPGSKAEPAPSPPGVTTVDNTWLQLMVACPLISQTSHLQQLPLLTHEQWYSSAQTQTQGLGM